jgi:hypothetical protein
VYRGPLLSAMAVSVVVSALVVHGISPCRPVTVASASGQKAAPPSYAADVDSGI